MMQRYVCIYSKDVKKKEVADANRYMIWFMFMLSYATRRYSTYKRK